MIEVNIGVGKKYFISKDCGVEPFHHVCNLLSLVPDWQPIKGLFVDSFEDAETWLKVEDVNSVEKWLFKFSSLLF